MTRTRAKKPADVKSNCEPISQEPAATRDDQRVANAEPPAESAEQPLKLHTCKRGNVTKLTLEGGAPMDAYGSTDDHFLRGLVDQVANASSSADFPERPDQLGIGFMLAVIRGIEPRDQIDAMLASQMAAVHVHAMKYANRLAHAEDLVERESAERGLVKLTRIFAAQVEALKRYRTGGEQTVTVQHVSVSEGGQAIVGNVTQSAAKKPADETPALIDARQSAMPIINQPMRAPVAVHRRGKNGRRPSA